MDKQTIIATGIGVVGGVLTLVFPKKKWIGFIVLGIGIGMIVCGLLSNNKEKSKFISVSDHSNGQALNAPGAGIAALANGNMTIVQPQQMEPLKTRHLDFHLRKRLDRWTSENLYKLKRASRGKPIIFSVEIQVPMNDSESDDYAEEIKAYLESKRDVKVYDIHPTAWGLGAEPEHGEVYLDRVFPTINVGRDRP